MHAANEMWIECRRSGRPYERFDGREKGYDIIAVIDNDDGTAHVESYVAFAVKARNARGETQRGLGWVLLDYDDGHVLQSTAAVTIGRGLDDALFIYARTLEEQRLGHHTVTGLQHP